MKCVLRSNGKRHECTITQDESKLYFKTPFALKGEVKAMKGARWNPEEKIWTATRCPRNLFQLRTMMVEPVDENPYAWFEQPLADIQCDRPLTLAQVDMLRRTLTYHYQIIAADMGLGKSLFAIETIERNPGKWIVVGPTSALESIEADRIKWGSMDNAELMTYEKFRVSKDLILKDIPLGIIFDECTALKTPSTANAKTAQAVADKIREVHGFNGFVIAMSGTTTAKLPSDIWSQAEVVWPGFLREGSLDAFKSRYANIVMREDMDGVKFPYLEGWKEHEVARLPQRLSGLMTTYFKTDWLNLPPRHFEVRNLPPSGLIKRIGAAICDAAPNTISALTALRALSSGFQYKDDEEDAANGDRAMVQTKCPKDDALREILAEEESRGRMIAFASFQGSIDRVRRICEQSGWDAITIDGRGWTVWKDGEKQTGYNRQAVLQYWSDNPKRTVVIGNPASCRFGLTLVEAKTILYFDQGFSAEHRLQSMDRNYRMGQTDEVRVIDLIHLPVDKLVLDTLSENKRLEDLSIGRIQSSLET